MKPDEPMTPEEAKRLSKHLSFAGKSPKTGALGDQTGKEEKKLKTKKHVNTPEADIIEPTLRSALDLGRIDTFGETVNKSVLDLIVETKQAAAVERARNRRASARERTREGAAEGSTGPVSMEKQAEADVAKNNAVATKSSITDNPTPGLGGREPRQINVTAPPGGAGELWTKPEKQEKPVEPENTGSNWRLKDYFSSPEEQAAAVRRAGIGAKTTINPTPGLGGREKQTIPLSPSSVKSGEPWKNVQRSETDKAVDQAIGILGKGVASSKARTDADYAKQLEMRREQKSSTKSTHDTFNMLKGSIQRIRNEKGRTSYKGGTFFGRIGARVSDFLGLQRSGKDMESSVNAWNRPPNDTDLQAQSGYGKKTRISTYPEDAFDSFSNKTSLPTSKAERDELERPTSERWKERFDAEQASKEPEAPAAEPEAPKPTEAETPSPKADTAPSETPAEAKPTTAPKKGPSMKELLAGAALPDASDPEALKKAGIPTTGTPPPAEAKPAAAPAAAKPKLDPEARAAKKKQEDELARQKGFKQGAATGLSSQFKQVLNKSYTAWAARKPAELANYAASVNRRT